MNLLKNNWQYIVIVLLLATIILGGKLYFDKYQDHLRLQDNIEQISKDFDTKVLEITKREYAKSKIWKDSLLLSIIDNEKLKPKQIERIVVTKYETVHDTIIKLIPVEKDSTYKVFNHRFDDCVEVIGKVNWAENMLVFDSLKIDYNSTTAYYWKRKHNFWFINWGRKQYFATTINNCTGDSKVTDIKFEQY